MTDAAYTSSVEFARVRLSDGRLLRIPLPPPPPYADPENGFIWDKPAPVYLLPPQFRPKRYSSDGNGEAGRQAKPKRPPGRPRKTSLSDPPLRLSDDELWGIRYTDLWRPVDWPWKLAGHLIAADKLPRPSDGVEIALAWFYRQAQPNCKTETDLAWLRVWLPTVHQALALRGHRPTCLEVEARLLAAEPFGEIARKLACSEQAIAMFSRLFFDVADRLQAKSWVTHYAIGLHGDRPREALEQLGRLWKFFGYWGGPTIVDEMVFEFSEVLKPKTADEVKRFFDQAATAAIRRKAALALHLMPIDTPAVARRVMRAAQQLLEMEARQQRAQRQAGPAIDPLPGIKATLAGLPAEFFELLSRRETRQSCEEKTGQSAE